LIVIILAVGAILPGAFTALVVAQDGSGQLTYFLSSSNADSIHSQLATAPGGLAWDYLQGEKYSSLKVEWASFDRNILDSRNSPFSSFESLILDNCNKSSITYTFVAPIDAALKRSTYSESDLNSMGSSVFKNTSSNGVAIVHILFLTGSFSDPTAVGISYTGDRFAVFGDTLTDVYLRVTVAHEMGHLLGLVAPLGLDSPYTPTNASVHYDINNPPHCTSSVCIMRPTVSSYARTCVFCTADMREIKNSTAPYAFSNTQPTMRWGLIAVGAILTTTLAVSAMVLHRKNGSEQ
jgi:hypothetical protein